MNTNKYISDYPTPAFYTNWVPTASYTNFIFSIVALIAIIFLFYRVQLLATTIATMQITVHRTAATSPTLPTILSYFNPTARANVTTSTQLPQFLKVIELNSTSPYLFFLCIILLLLLIYKKYRHCKSNPNSCSLILEFDNSTETLQIPCQTLPGSPTQYTFSASEFIKSVLIIGRFQKSTTVSWPSLRIHNKYLQTTFYFSNHISLCPLQAYRLQRIINGKFWCIISLRYEQCLFRVDIAPGPTTGMPDQHPISLEVVQINDLAAVRVIPETIMAPHVDE